MEIVFEQEIYFSNKDHLLLTDVAKSLLAFDKNAKATPLALEKLFDDVVAQDIQLYVEELKSGSLTEKIKFRLKLAIQDQIEDESGVKLNLLSQKPQKKKEEIVSWIVVAVFLYGVKIAIDKFNNDSNKPNIQQQINITLNQGEEITGIDKEILNKKLNNSLEETPGAIQGAIEFTRPAKKDSNASISIDNNVILSKEAIAEVPSMLADLSQLEKSIELEKTEIVIRATDRDSAKRGWGATFPEFSDRRMKVSVAPGIDLNELAHKDSVTGNVTIFYCIDERGNTSKQHAHIFSVDLGN